MLFAKAILFMLLIASPVKLIVWAVFILSGIALLLIYILPNAPQPSQPPHPPPGGSKTLLLKGVVKQFESNRTGDIDKVLISNNDSDYQVMFPPHTAKQIMSLAPKGTSVNVTVVPGKIGPEEFASFKLVEITAGSNSLLPENIAPPPPSAGKAVVLSGPIQKLLINDREEVSGFLLDSFWIIIPPHFSRSITPLLQPGSFVQVQGYERNASDGFVNKNGSNLLKPYRITIDSTDYLL